MQTSKTKIKKSAGIKNVRVQDIGNRDGGVPNSPEIYALAPVQRQALQYLRNFISDHGFAPTLKDISEYLGVRSVSTAHFHLSRLEQKGFIKKNTNGSIELLEKNPDHLKIQNSPCAVPLLGLIAAGAPIEALEDSSVTIDIPPQYFDRKREIFCLQVTGDSMIDAHIMDGDIIIVEKRETADNGQIVVALLDDGTATLKTFRRLKGGKVMLIPHNPAHTPITLDSVSIQGRLIGLMREL
ncbi:MAG TPA: transcriptional repressor LexA [Oligoflexia bacterium]|nr:transcriptional repressor LexA [Oligoflexia bacterium]HMP47178.1 transcriptional repressor LexA [Oligoflexia bacterium]